MTRTIDSSVAYFSKLQSSLLSLSFREFTKLRLLLQQKRQFKIKLYFKLTVPRLFHVDHVQYRRGALSLSYHEWFPRKSKEWKIYCCGLAIGSLRSTIRRQRQRHKFCIFKEQKQNIISLHGKIWTQQIDLAPNVWPHISVGRSGISEVTGSNAVKALIF